MNIVYKIAGFIISLPARMKGTRIGRDSFIGPGYDWLFVRLKGIALGNEVLIGKNAWLQTQKTSRIDPQIIIGDKTQIGRNATISAISRVAIGKNCIISYNVSLLDHDHEFADFESPNSQSRLSKGQPIKIEDNCFIGAHTFILKGVRLGKNCVVGANSVVTKSFPSFSIIAGNPARLIKK